MNIRRVPIWSCAVPRHHLTHECIAIRFAAANGLGGVFQVTRGGSGPFQFHVAEDRRTFEVERSEPGGGIHEYRVSALEWEANP